VHVLDDEHMPAGEVLRGKRGFHGDVSGGVEAGVGLDFDEEVGVLVFQEFDEVRVEHEGALEDADQDEFEGALLLPDVVVVLVDLVREFMDGLLDGLLVVEQSELYSLVLHS